MRQRKPARLGTSAEARPALRPAAATEAAFWMYGRHAVLAAVANPRRSIDRLLALPETAAVLRKAAATAPVPRPQVEVAERRTVAAVLSPDAVHQGFAARARALPAPDLDDVLERQATAPLLVVLDQVTDPRNVGAVLRSAQAFGAAAVVVQERHAPGESGALAKAASGALESVPVVRVTNLARTLRALQERGFRCVGLEAHAETPIGDAGLAGPLALVLGAEGAGLRRLLREACDLLVRIPIATSVDSLNLSAAAAIALYECGRARGFEARVG